MSDYSIFENNPAFGYQRSSRIVTNESGYRWAPEEWEDVSPVEEDTPVEGPVDTELHFSVSEFVEKAFKISDKKKGRVVPFTFGSDRRYLQQIYDSTAKRVLLKFGRQSEKSTLLGNYLISMCCLMSSLRCLYVSPAALQTKTFSKDRLDEPFYISDHLFSWTTPEMLDNQQLKRFLNLSQITLRYAFLNADRTRGISADLIALDELQDILTDNIPVIEECSFASPLKLARYSGTPKSLDNTIEVYWGKFSTQNEWVIPCHRHTILIPGGGATRIYYNIVTEESLGKHSLICDRCGQPITPKDPECQWAAMNSDIYKNSPDPDSVFEGYRIPQVITPMCVYSELMQKQKDYPRARFLNEKLALPSDEGTKPITQDELIANCNPHVRRAPEYLERIHQKMAGMFPIYAGIDWLGGSKANSYTVFTLGSYFDTETFNYFYYRRFEGAESDLEFQIREIARLIEKWRPQIVGTDYGGSLWAVDQLIRKFGANRVFTFQYSTPSRPVIWDEGLSRFLVHRTKVMGSFFNAIKRKGVLTFPNWDDWQEPFGKDFLNIFSEFNERTNQNDYKKTPGKTDDGFHASLYALLGSMLKHPRPDLLMPQDGTR